MSEPKDRSTASMLRTLQGGTVQGRSGNTQINNMAGLPVVAPIGSRTATRDAYSQDAVSGGTAQSVDALAASIPWDDPIVQQALNLGMSPQMIASYAEPVLDQYDRPIPGQYQFNYRFLQAAMEDQQLFLGRQATQEAAAARAAQQEEGGIGYFSTPQEAEQFVMDNGLEGYSIGLDPDKGFYPTPIQTEDRNLESLIVEAIDAGNFERAVALDNFKNRPSSTQALQMALQFATSPADLFTLSAVARGQLSLNVPPGEVGSLPRSPLITQIYERWANDAVGNFDDIPPLYPDVQRVPEPVQEQPPAPEPTPVAELRQPMDFGVPLSQPTTYNPKPYMGPVPDEDLDVDDPRFGANDPIGGELEARRILMRQGITDPALQDRILKIPTASPQPVSEPRAPISPIGESIRPRTAREQEGFVRKLYPANEPVEDLGYIPPIGGVRPPTQRTIVGGEDFSRPGYIQDDLSPLPPPPDPNIDRFRTNRFSQEEVAPLIPPGTPTSQITFNGQQRDIPVGLEPIFNGGRPVRRPGSILAKLGIPELSAQAQRNLLPGELAAYMRLAQEAGLPPEYIQREMRSHIPQGGRQRRIGTASGGF